MTLYNKTQKKVITKNLKFAESFVDNLFGLLKEKKDTALLLKTRFGLHTFYMQYPIDVLVLDNKNKIVKIKKNLKPNRLFLWHPTYSTVIELPINTLVRKNDELEIINT